MTNLHRLSIRELSEGLQQGKFSSRELTQHYLKRIEKIDAQVKSYVTVTPEQALSQADAADAAIKAGNATALAGIPLRIKTFSVLKALKPLRAQKCWITSFHLTMPLS
jgi:aspartyl-tRNA(Asn)/glutamyl-tRNA(Gln) amidotransferase subunit A